MRYIYPKNKRKLLSLLFLFACLLISFSVCTSIASPPADKAVWSDRSIFQRESNASGNSGRDLLLYPGGMSFGVKFYTDGVLVVGFSGGNAKPSGPAYNAGLRAGDTILKINGNTVNDAAELTDAIESSEGKCLDLTCRRNGKNFSVSLSPQKGADGIYKTGMWVRDSGAGIGTVTFTVPETGGFGGLGHGICDADTGKPIPISRGSVVGVTISGVEKGKPGAPGEIKGYFDSNKVGSVILNTDLGVFGIYREIPKGKYSSPIPAAKCDEITDGAAVLLCTLDDGEICEYSIEISGIDRTAKGGRCFSVRVTDKALLERTGGIIQGMSGSPIIQNGKIIGAVTHVLVNDPASGYGIFIDNMYNIMPEVLK